MTFIYLKDVGRLGSKISSVVELMEAELFY
jgi:hypothetical protein